MPFPSTTLYPSSTTFPSTVPVPVVPATYVGGLRARLVHDSVYEMLRNSLDALGWFDAHASHSTITFNAEALSPDIEVPLNTMALADEDEEGTDLELGSSLQELRWTMWLDFYAENDTIGLHVIRDVKDILEGRMPSIGRARPVVQVYDFTQATPVAIFNVDIEDVRTDKGRDFTQPWLRNWRACIFTVVDTYTDDETIEPAPLPVDGAPGGFGGF